MISFPCNRFRLFHLARGRFQVICIGLLFLCGCGYLEQDKKEYVISVGSKDLTLKELKRDMEFMTSGLEANVKEWGLIRDRLVDRIIDHYLILEYARDRNISISEGELHNELKEIKKEYTRDAFKEELLRGYVDSDDWEARVKEQLLVKKVTEVVLENVKPPSYEDIKNFFEKHKEEYNAPQMIKFRQIVTREKEEASELLRRIQQGEDMGELARKYSIAPEAEKDGLVGWLARENLHESMGDVLFSLSQGEVSRIVKSPYGYHIFQVLAAREKGVRELPEVKGEIESRILGERRNEYYAKWLKGLRSEFKILVNKDLLNKMEIS